MVKVVLICIEASLGYIRPLINKSKQEQQQQKKSTVLATQAHYQLILETLVSDSV